MKDTITNIRVDKTQAEPSANQNNPTKKLVLIEDFKLIRIGLRTVLNGDASLEVVGEGETAQQGLALIETLKPELVILDLSLPDMSGLALTRKIRDRHPEIKILVLSAHEQEEDVLLALAAGANAYCLKDILSDRLVQVVKSVCMGCTWLDPRIASRALCVFSTNTHANPIALTRREREVLRLLVEGMNHTQVTSALQLNLQATKTLIHNIIQKLALQEGITKLTRSLQPRLPVF